MVVGTPATDVTPSRSIRSTACTASHLYMRTILPPPTVYGRRNECSPPTWNSGNVRRVMRAGGAAPDDGAGAAAAAAIAA